MLNVYFKKRHFKLFCGRFFFEKEPTINANNFSGNLNRLFFNGVDSKNRYGKICTLFRPIMYACRFRTIMQAPVSVVTSTPSLSADIAGAGVGCDFHAVTFGHFCGRRCRPRLLRRHFRPILRASVSLVTSAPSLLAVLQVPVSAMTSTPSLSAVFAGAGVGCDFHAVNFGRLCGCRCRPRLPRRHFRAKVRVPGGWL